MLFPVIHADSLLIKYKIISAISEGSPIRLKTEDLAPVLTNVSVSPPDNIGVFVIPGDTVLTRIPLGPSSFAKVLVKPSIANLLAT